MSLNLSNSNTNPLDDKTSGINKHLYSTNPDLIVGENIYSSDKTSINKEESYQTLDNKTISLDTGDKVNPFHVKGVPGCKSCGGSGWKDAGKHPHPCNECAKITVPVIDTYLTKVGHTTGPLAETAPADKIFSRDVQERDYVPTREVTVTRDVPITREIKYTEEVPVRTQVPVIRYEEQVENMPVERVEYITENVPITTTTTVPLTDVDQNIRNQQATTSSSEVYFGTDITQGVYSEINPAISGTATSSGLSSSIPVRLDENFSGYQDINREVERNRLLAKDSHVHDDKLIKETNLPVPTTGELTGTNIPDYITSQTVGTTGQFMNFVGVPGCKECGGDGWRRSKLTGAKKPCRHCISITGNCPLCGNTGRRLDKDKKCKCIYAK